MPSYPKNSCLTVHYIPHRRTNGRIMAIFHIPSYIRGYLWSFSQSTIGSKISLTPKGGRFCEDNLLHYLDLCNVNPAYHRLKTILYYRLWTNQKIQEIVFAKSATMGKGYFAAAGTYISLNKHFINVRNELIANNILSSQLVNFSRAVALKDN